MSGMKRIENGDYSIVRAPFDESLPPRKRTEIVIELSELVTRIVTHVICHAIVDHEELLEDERMSVAHAFLQRVTTTHMCNHKLTAEGIVYEFNGQSFHLHEEYKTMTLTRTVYEHLAMFYFLFVHPKTTEERDEVWQNWKSNDKKNSQTVPFSQAWKYLYTNSDMRMIYHHLSMHCHPVYDGLVQFQSQSASDEGEDGIPLYLSCSFLAYLCRLFLEMIPNGEDIIKNEFTAYERHLFRAISQKK